MTKTNCVKRALLYGLIFLSGMAGLTYQVVWHRYLSILLGAQARATAIVLMIFLGGISAGYAVFGKWSRWKKWNLLLAYAIVELGLGLWAMAFPFLFRGALPLTPKLYQALGLGNLSIDVCLSLLLIGFPTFLMGGTLPLLTQGLSEDLKEASHTHARIYGFNTLGACLGCLLAGYVIIPHLGLAAASALGGVVNLLVALVTYAVFAKGQPRQTVAPRPKESGKKFRFTPRQKILLGIGFLSGFYLITLETILIRLVGLSTGSSNYNFCLIVSIFIFGLGIGSLVARNISNYDIRRLFWNQTRVACLLMLVYCTGDSWAYYGHVFRAVLRDLPENFYLYQTMLGLGLFALLILPLGLSGLTLPLCFHFMKDTREDLGDRVGQLYSVNTIGCVLGAVVGGYVLLNFLDLDQLFKLCVFAALATAVMAGWLWRQESEIPQIALVTGVAMGVVVVGGLVFAPRFVKDRFIQPFRHASPVSATFKGPEEYGRYLSRSTKIVYWKDGPNTSLGVGSSGGEKESSRSIIVNGKSDGNTRGDFFTTVMLAHLPAILSKRAERVCVIGFGTGITIGTLSQYPEVKKIEVVEISNTIIENAHLFDAYNFRASSQPKVHFNEMDAFRFLYGTPAKFDIIISEPSNPWVAGIENLYSSEFYNTAFDKLEDDGVFAQWIHTYSFNDELFRMVLKTMSQKFPVVSTFQLTGGDLAIIGRKKPFTADDLAGAKQRFSAVLQNGALITASGIDQFETMLAMEVIPYKVTPLLARGAQIHRLESPKLSNEAAKAFFVNSSAKILALRRQPRDYYSVLGSSLLATHLAGGLPTPQMLEGFRGSFCDSRPSHTDPLCQESMVMSKILTPGFSFPQSNMEGVSFREISSLNYASQPKQKAFTSVELRSLNEMFDTYKRFASPIARFPLAPLNERLDVCVRTIPETDELYGECMLQKLMIIEAATGESAPYYEAMKAYLNWFPRLSASSPNYKRLNEAKNILTKLLPGGG